MQPYSESYSQTKPKPKLSRENQKTTILCYWCPHIMWEDWGSSASGAPLPPWYQSWCQHTALPPRKVRRTQTALEYHSHSIPPWTQWKARGPGISSGGRRHLYLPHRWGRSEVRLSPMGTGWWRHPPPSHWGLQMLWCAWKLKTTVLIEPNWKGKRSFSEQARQATGSRLVPQRTPSTCILEGQSLWR